MGWGTITVRTSRKADPPERLLAGFIGEDTRVELMERLRLRSGLYQYSFGGTCGVFVYCSNCGEEMCAGCGGKPELFITETGGASATCSREECRSHLAERLREWVYGAG